MEHMTDEMKDIAHKTQTETISMKIITLVTLFFLPGTFISVSHPSLRIEHLVFPSTSTEIVATRSRTIAQRSVELSDFQN